MAGVGTVADTCVVTNCSQLQAMHEWVHANFSLGNSFSCDIAPYNSGSGFSPVGNETTGSAFIGRFYGNNYVISDLFINKNGRSGLFGDVNTASVSAKIYDVGLDNVNITATGSYVGALVGWGPSVIINNSYGAGHYAMNNIAFDADLIFAWPNAKIGVMKQSTIYNAIDSGNIQIDHSRMCEDKESAFYAASRLWIDEIIEPIKTRKILSKTLRFLNYSDQL